MESKRIIVKDNEFDFFYDERINMWRTIDNPNLIEGVSIDVEIDLVHFPNALNWDEVKVFIELLKSNNFLFIERIEDSKELLKAFFKVVMKKAYSDDFYKHIQFNLSGIDFKGCSENVNLRGEFEYDYFFFPQYVVDPYRDIGAFVWRAHFRNAILLGVSCDR